MDLTEKNIPEFVSRDSPLYVPEFAQMYSDIEREIIQWSNDGTKTAGVLTRRIIMIFHNSMNDE